MRRHGRLFGILLIGLLGAGTLAGAAGLAGFAGFIVGKYRIAPFETVEAVEWTVFDDRWKTAARRDALTSGTIPTAFLRLRLDAAAVPRARDGAGGGLTSLGDTVLLITHDGRILAATGPDDLRRTAIAPPDNGFEAYRAAAAAPPLDGLDHSFETFRYNDILAFEGEGGPSLALSFTWFDGEASCYATRVAALALDPADPLGTAAGPEDWRILHTTRPCLSPKATHRAIEGHIAGGRLAFRGPDTLYLGQGDYHLDGLHGAPIAAQDPAMEYGKVLAIDLDDGAVRTVSLGHRNIQGMVVDREGTLWAAEHGMRGGDELNRIVEGANYGWPLESLGTLYNREPIPVARSYGRHEAFAAPVHAWVPSVATSGLTVVDGFHPAWDDDLLMGSLKAGTLYRMRVRDGRVVFVEPIPVGERIRYVHQHTDGRLVLWADSHSLYFVTAEPLATGVDFVASYFEDAPDPDSVQQRVLAAARQCGECHSFEPGEHAGAPSLAGRFRAPVAGTPFATYSPALRAVEGRWTRERLARFLDDPDAIAPGTTMPDPGLDDPAVIDRLIDLLAAMSEAAG
ncbi:MAG: PQQ-dependent sugar dehydrogenase [Azospirillaceae bacterium]